MAIRGFGSTDPTCSYGERCTIIYRWRCELVQTKWSHHHLLLWCRIWGSNRGATLLHQLIAHTNGVVGGSCKRIMWC